DRRRPMNAAIAREGHPMENAGIIANRHVHGRNAKPAAPRRALLVVAEPSSNRLCQEVLEALGFSVEAVDSGIGAVIAVRERTPQVVLLDSQLRDVPAREAVRWLRSNRNLGATPIVILAGANEEERLMPALRPGAILRKPLSVEALRRVISYVLEGSSGDR